MKQVANIDGFKFKKSNVTKCKAGYAVGYYHYATEEKMEAFFPVGRSYVMNLQSFSVKPYHEINFVATYNCIGPNKEGCVKRVIKSYTDKVVGDSGFVQNGFNMKL